MIRKVGRYVFSGIVSSQRALQLTLFFTLLLASFLLTPPTFQKYVFLPSKGITINFKRLDSRLSTNLVYFRTNYLIATLFFSVYTIVNNPWIILVAMAVGLGWIYVLSVHKGPPKIGTLYVYCIISCYTASLRLEFAHFTLYICLSVVQKNNTSTLFCRSLPLLLCGPLASFSFFYMCSFSRRSLRSFTRLRGNAR